MNFNDLFLQLRSLIVGILSVFGLSQALTVALANFSLAAIAIVLLLIYPQVVVVILLALFLLFALKH